MGPGIIEISALAVSRPEVGGHCGRSVRPSTARRRQADHGAGVRRDPVRRRVQAGPRWLFWGRGVYCGLSASCSSLAFYALAIWCYLRRGPAVATSGSITAHAAAVAATWLPFTLPCCAARRRDRAARLCPTCCWCAAWRGRCGRCDFSAATCPYLRRPATSSTRGPYRWVRHPALCRRDRVLAWSSPSPSTATRRVALWLVLCGLQVYRAVREEQVLLQALPAYRDYRSRTAALLPGVF